MNGHQTVLSRHHQLSVREGSVWRPEAAGRVGTVRTSGGLSTQPGTGAFLLCRHCAAPLHKGPSGQIWVAELKPIISFAPSILCLIRRAVSFTSLFSCWRRSVAAEQGVLLKAASCPRRLPFHLGGPPPGLAQSSPRLNFFSLHKNSRGDVFGSPCLP